MSYLKNEHQVFVHARPGTQLFEQVQEILLRHGKKGNTENVMRWLWRLTPHVIDPRNVLRDLEHLEQVASGVEPPPPPIPPAREGVVRMHGLAAADDGGPYLALGATSFGIIQALDQGREEIVRDNLLWLRKAGITFLRVSALNGAHTPFWQDYRMHPDDPGYWRKVERAFDLFAEYGMRVHLMLLGPPEAVHQALPAHRHKPYMQSWLNFLDKRREQVQWLEIINEYWHDGTIDGLTLEQLRDYSRWLRDRTDFLTIPSAPFGQNIEEAIKEMHEGGISDMVTAHLPRRHGEDGWRFTRQAWHVGFATRQPWVSGEPLGPGSSVEQTDDPHKLVTDAINTFIADGAGYVFHSDVGLKHEKRFTSIRTHKELQSAFAGMVEHLPADLANWSRKNGGWPGHPFRAAFYRGEGVNSAQHWADGPDRRGVNRAYGATRGGQYVVMLGGIKAHVNIGTGNYRVLNPVTWEETGEVDRISANHQSRVVTNT